MNSEERQLISGLFDRIRSQGSIDKDRDAEGLIMQSLRQNPDAPYLLVQSILVQDHALQLSEQKMQELEARVVELEDQLTAKPQPQAQQSSGGSFLGGLFGGGSQARPAPAPQRSSAGFGGGQPQRAGAAPSPWGQSPAQPPQQAAQPAPAGGGGFMRQAMATAAGVAGGMLAANAISGMLGGGSSAQAAQNNSSSDFADSSSNNGNDFASSGDNDPGYTDAGYDDSNGGWGDDDIEV